jgi:ketosteroid isomerase-like protein
MMTTATFNQPAGSLRHYFTDVSNAARAFAEALFAAQGRQFVAQEVRSTKVSERTKVESRRQIFALAKEHEQMSPNLAAELRFFASKD